MSGAVPGLVWLGVISPAAHDACWRGARSAHHRQRPEDRIRQSPGGGPERRHAVSTDVRPLLVIAALEEEAHELVRRMPRSENVGPRLAIWEGDGLVAMVAGVGKVAPAMATPDAGDVVQPRAGIAVG